MMYTHKEPGSVPPHPGPTPLEKEMAVLRKLTKQQILKRLEKELASGLDRPGRIAKIKELERKVRLFEEDSLKRSRYTQELELKLEMREGEIKRLHDTIAIGLGGDV